MRIAWKWVLLAALLGLVGTAGSALAQGGGDPVHGAQIYLTYCATCHGEDAGGRVGANLKDFPGINAGSAIEQTIRDGIPGSVMPAWSQANGGPLSDSDIQDVSTYLVAIMNGTAPIAPAPTYQAAPIATLPQVEGDPSAGAVVFQSSCSGCHGERAEGKFGWPLAKTWSGNEPQAYIRTVVSEGIPGSIMPAWSQANGGPLSDQQIANVAAYILSLQPVEGLPTPAPESSGPITLTVSLILFAILGAIAITAIVLYYRKA
jgi:cbb3-type cytochrome c oxidase subunit III